MQREFDVTYAENNICSLNIHIHGLTLFYQNFISFIFVYRNKKRRTPKKGKSADTVPEYASDDETLYGTRNDPDPDSREYFYDDIDEFHAHREKVLLEKSYKPEERVTESDEVRT